MWHTYRVAVWKKTHACAERWQQGDCSSLSLDTEISRTLILGIESDPQLRSSFAGLLRAGARKETLEPGRERATEMAFNGFLPASV
jgi:hypothetical protein